MIPLAVPNLTGKEAEYTAQAISSGWVGPDGPFVRRFEEMVAKAAGRKWAVATITGTAALHTASMALGLYKTRQHVPRLAFPAMANVLYDMHCERTLIDGGEDHDFVCYGTWMGSVADRAPAIGEPRTRATLECYSFAANKTATCGHGGAVCGDEEEDVVREAVRQGHRRAGTHNYRMANINAAIGCAQMERLEEFRAAKKRIWNTYRDAGLPMVERGNSRWMSTIRADESLVDYMREKGIECRVEPGIGVSLPCSTSLTEVEQAIVIEAYLSFRPVEQTRPRSLPSLTPSLPLAGASAG